MGRSSCLVRHSMSITFQYLWYKVIKEGMVIATTTKYNERRTYQRDDTGGDHNFIETHDLCSTVSTALWYYGIGIVYRV